MPTEATVDGAFHLCPPLTVLDTICRGIAELQELW